jgi:anaerobic magnesium-protoporphyrin IX monomethyl ester cyclase
MNILMIEVPTYENDGSIPFGLLYAASSAYRHGHNVKIIDLVKEDLSNDDLIDVIREYSPGVIGMGGITSSYRRCKELIKNIKDHFKTIPIVVGGVITSVADLLLTKAGADYVVHGEGEITFPNLINALEKKEDMTQIKGISFFTGGTIQRTEREQQIQDLDDIPIPEYSLLKMEHYLETMDKWIAHYFSIQDCINKDIQKILSGKRYMFPIITARGCTHKCIFCYRHHRGLRQHSVDYVLNMMQHLHDNYGVAVFQINDELTTGSKAWVRDFCNGIIKKNLPVAIIILSARVDTVDEEILSMLKDINCIMINYGYESGSDTILKEIRKGVTREQALNAGLLTIKIGIKNVPEIIIGFPSETRETVEETIDFLKQLDVWPISVNTPIPFPETYLWNYAVEHNLIDNKEEFVLGYKRGHFVNFTQFSDRELTCLVSKVHYDTYLSWLRRRGQYYIYLKVLFIKFFAMYIRRLLPEPTFTLLKKVYNKF